MDKIYIILYNEGTYKEIVAVYWNEENVRNRVKELEDQNYSSDVYYTYETFNLL